jgi:hypothetical protein
MTEEFFFTADLRDWRTVLRLWDIIICVGRPALFGIALSILKVCESVLLSMSSLDQMLPQLLNLTSSLLTYSNLLSALRSFDISSLLARAERDYRHSRTTKTLSRVYSIIVH